jgi:ABC-type branched-subunit amino acid transport system substrate-binding protein
VRPRKGAVLLALPALVTAGRVLTPAFADEASPEARRGKQIYLRGDGSSRGEISAFVGGGETAVPASVLPCVSCHGHDGEGRPEGGVAPSDVTWERLTKPYGVTHDSGRKHPAYDEATMARAIVDGVDPAGNELLAAMPRYRMPREDLGDLVAFMKRLGRDKDPGLTDTTIRLGTFVPRTGPGAEVGEAMRAVLAAEIDRINERGGIFNRRLELRVLPPPDAADVAGRGLGHEDVFALVGGLGGPGAGGPALAESQEIPWIGPWTLDAEPGSSMGRFVFYLFSGLREQALGLVTFAEKELPREGRSATILHPETASGRALGEAVEERCRRSGWVGVSRLGYGPARPLDSLLAGEAMRSQGGAVFFLGPSADLAPVFHQAAGPGWTSSLFLPGALAGRDVLDLATAGKGKVFLAFPSLPLSPDSDGGREYGELLRRYELSPRHEAFQLWAYAAGKVLVAGLTSAGRRLSRERLVTALEGLYEFETGVTARISYGPRRRVGAQGAYVLVVDPSGKGLTPTGRHVAPE